MSFDVKYLAVAAAALLVLWPQIWSLIKTIKLPAVQLPQVTSDGVSYQESMLALATVRRRLEATGGVPEDAGHAIEVITHALVEGSGK